MTGVVVTAALIVGALFTVLAAPHLLARQTWLRSTPGETLFLWQAVALSGVVAALLAAPVAVLSLPTDRPWLRLAAYAVSLAMLVRLLVSGHLVGTDLRRRRAEHRQLVDILGERIERTDARAEGVTVLARGNPTVYCLPGRHDRIVLSREALERLGPEELDAVMAHEQAHLSQRHDLLLELFTVLHEAVPRRVRADAALDEVHLLAEMLADRAAARRVGPLALAHALVAMAGGHRGDAGGEAGGTAYPGPPAGTLAGGTQVTTRLRAFAADPAPGWARAGIFTVAVAQLLLPVLLLLPLLWTTSQFL
ncbi:M56 family metallopeptidase [Ornithinimicrobium pekingense]|uniref:Integral membrane protein n=1 Tax=Ornithinimicrobium pekingense TaxID=384677 RepID=A0ABQ2F6S1_9MICO|nr:M56 family metallopeptidase [Ornithinimicrobium pekingense]GGK56822.1 integral membrane protein [Ornithinimicrobium pekingense]